MPRIYKRRPRNYFPMGRVPFLTPVNNLLTQQFGFAENASIYSAANGRIWAVTNNAIPQIVPVRENFKDNSMGDGAEFTHRKEIISQTVTYTPQFRLSPEVCAYWMAMAMGDVTTLGTGVDFATRYQHEIRVQDGRGLPLFHFVWADGRDEGGGPEPKVYRNNIVSGVKISGASPGSNAIFIEPTILGSGQFVNQAHTFGTPDRPRPYRMSDIEALFSSTPYELDFSANGVPLHSRIKNWEVEFTNGNGETQVPGAQSIFQNLLEHGGERTAFFRINFTKDTYADTLQDLFLYPDTFGFPAGSVSAIQLNLTGRDHAETGATTSRKIHIEIPEMQTNNSSEGEDGTNAVWDIEFECSVNPDIGGYVGTVGDLLQVLIDGGIGSEFSDDYPV